MFRFTPRQIEIFLTVCRVRSFNLAAEQLRISQAAVSEQMRFLERQIGTLLFVRSPGKSIDLTSDGLRFRDGARSFELNGRELGRMFLASGPQQVRAFIGIYLLEEFVQRALPQFLIDNPDIMLKFNQDMSGNDIDDAIDRGEIDCVLLSRPLSRPMGQFTALGREAAYIYATREIRDIALSQGIANIPFILWSIPPLRRSDQLQLLASAGVFNPRIHSEVQHHGVAAKLAAGGAGGVIMLQSTARIYDTENHLIPIAQVGVWERRAYISDDLDLSTKTRLLDFFRQTSSA